MHDKLFKKVLKINPNFRQKFHKFYLIYFTNKRLQRYSLLVSKIDLTVPLLLKSCEDIEIDMFGGPGFEI